jgi:hypothetical protein
MGFGLSNATGTRSIGLHVGSESGVTTSGVTPTDLATGDSEEKDEGTLIDEPVDIEDEEVGDGPTEDETEMEADSGVDIDVNNDDEADAERGREDGDDMGTVGWRVVEVVACVEGQRDDTECGDEPAVCGEEDDDDEEEGGGGEEADEYWECDEYWDIDAAE